MDLPPICIFSRRIDPRGVAQLLRSLGGDFQMTGPEDDWQEIEVQVPSGFLRRPKPLKFSHDAQYYDGPRWPRQMLGMQGYFSQFPDSPRKADALRLIATFRFSISVLQYDLDIHTADPRLQVVFAVCRHLDGVFFLPGSLYDASGKIIIDCHGNSEPEARLPQMPAVPDTPADQEDAATEPADEEELAPPTPLRVMRRAMVLAAVSNRALIENEAEKFDDPDGTRERMLAWIEELELGDELEPEEWKVLQRPVGTLDQQAMINAMWRVEGLGVLAWALRLYELPPYDQLVSPPDLYDALGLMSSEAGASLLASPELRSQDELNEMNAHFLAFHWRLRNFSIRPEPMDFVQFSKDCWFGGFDVSRFRVIAGDLAIGDAAIAEAPEEAVERAHSTAMERHLAINWLSGYSELYSETDTST
ncbi:MAG: DUF4272 domain-containing protein [Planctomycetia bacterium]|nr:DUF4272 domain-containing protein [Planctomycetia bacterium]